MACERSPHGVSAAAVITSGSFEKQNSGKDEVCRMRQNRNYQYQTNSHREDKHDNVLSGFFPFNSAWHRLLHRNYWLQE